MLVGTSETVDAGEVIAVLDLLDREALREGLACALIRRPTHRPSFDTLFDLWFPAAIGDRAVDDPLPRKRSDEVDLPALREMIAELLADGSPEAMQQVEALIGAMVEQLGRYGSARGPAYSAYQAVRALDLDALLERLVAGLMGAAAPGSDRDREDYRQIVAQRSGQQAVADFRSRLERETRRRSAEQLGRERVASYGVSRPVEEVDLLRANAQQLTELRRVIVPLARRLAARLAVRRRRSHHGAIDIRRTLRKSMSTGGVPIDLVTRKPRPGRPELVVLCDVSGSVAGFSSFTLLFVHALREQFARVRVFAFVDASDEVTDYFGAGTDLVTALPDMLRTSRLVEFDGHSDYGGALATFADRFAHVVTPRSALLILGDGRSNYRDPRLDVMADLVGRARHAHWLNPEERGLWGTGDSAAHRYGEVIEMHECRSASQLATVIEGLLPV
ncbi:VWA domain-containing protein [Millisia brevis]|uniref:VWA domain-containing protein n=1 Tax=Millisia brevis TaxID=264148 RepID=UPI000A06AD4B|nr:VWA domain-containing protein [Millisia brevis]